MDFHNCPLLFGRLNPPPCIFISTVIPFSDLHSPHIEQSPRQTGLFPLGFRTARNLFIFPRLHPEPLMIRFFIEADRIMRKEKWKTRLIGQIHDSILLDVYPPELDYIAKTIKRITTIDLPKAWKWIIVPLEIDAELCPVDGNWSEKKNWEIPN